MPDRTVKPTTPPPPLLSAKPERGQRNRMLLAVVLLLVAVTVVLVKDRESLVSDETDQLTSDPAAADMLDNSGATPEPATAEAALTTPAPAIDTPAPHASIPPVATERPAPVPKQSSHPKHLAARAGKTSPVAADAPGVTTTRAVLPPLRVEVVAGNRRTDVRPGNNSMRVDLQSGSTGPVDPPETVAAAVALADASEQVRMSTDSDLAVTHKVSPAYPALARQMKVQGSVVLEALIGKDGGIQDLHVVQGPTILADAAREAVRQWRFKPFYQDGQAVETQAHITVNFQISTN